MNTSDVTKAFEGVFLALTPPVNLPAPGTCQTIYVHLRVSMALCFW